MTLATLLDSTLKLIVIFLPWPLKRHALQLFWKYSLHPSSCIGLSWIYPRSMILHQYARIGNFSVAVNLDYIEVGCSSTIDRNNWITGFPTQTSSIHFAHQKDRKAHFIIGAHSAITKGHHIDCTNTVNIGSYTIIAGYRSQFLSHSIDLYHNRQHSDPIVIGSHCFVGTSCVILGGSILPDYSVLGALSLLNKPHDQVQTLYTGNPAKPVRKLSPETLYFTRTTGFVS